MPFHSVLQNVPFRSSILFHSFTRVNSNSSQLFLVRYRDMVYSNYKKQRILYFYFQGYKPPTITNFLREEGMSVSRRGVAKFVKCYRQTGSIARAPGSGRPTKVTAEVKKIVEEQMRLDDKTTAVQLHALLNSRGYQLSLRTILRCRTSRGWMFRGSSYCQLIREANKQK